ncbi:MAG: Gfo/Idh/MocA family oxidoreductase, partial [Anaerolineaceae bacterium]|nr:Gfo/Idh/MocA family oxidoreductase [Anaerolineaceae bacterium]
MSELRVGFIGTGRISDLHALEYLQNPGARIVAVCDTVVELAQERGKAWNVDPAQIYSDHREMLARVELDLVEILVPHHLHCAVMLDAAAAGVNISLQKPMALTMDDADAMNRAADKAGIVFKVFENFVFYPPVMRAKALIDAGEIGDPLTIRIKSNSATSPDAWPIPRAAEAWRFTPEQCGGGPLVFDDGHHKFALGWHFMGQAEAVHAWIDETEREPGNILDAPAIVSWKFPGGRYGSLQGGYSRDIENLAPYYVPDASG